MSISRLSVWRCNRLSFIVYLVFLTFSREGAVRFPLFIFADRFRKNIKQSFFADGFRKKYLLKRGPNFLFDFLLATDLNGCTPAREYFSGPAPCGVTLHLLLEIFVFLEFFGHDGME